MHNLFLFYFPLSLFLSLFLSVLHSVISWKDKNIKVGFSNVEFEKVWRESNLWKKCNQLATQDIPFPAPIYFHHHVFLGFSSFAYSLSFNIFLLGFNFTCNWNGLETAKTVRAKYIAVQSKNLFQSARDLRLWWGPTVQQQCCFHPNWQSFNYFVKKNDRIL